MSKILAIIFIYFIPAILFFLLVILLYIQAVLSSFFKISFIYQVLLVSLILFITFGAPFYLISFWRKLDICFSSFLAYFLNNFILLLHLFYIRSSNFSKRSFTFYSIPLFSNLFNKCYRIN